jgi:hypothetical protein
MFEKIIINKVVSDRICSVIYVIDTVLVVSPLPLSAYIHAVSLSIFTFPVLWHHVTLYFKGIYIWNFVSCFIKPYAALGQPLLMYTWYRMAPLLLVVERQNSDARIKSMFLHGSLILILAPFPSVLYWHIFNCFIVVHNYPTKYQLLLFSLCNTSWLYMKIKLFHTGKI